MHCSALKEVIKFCCLHSYREFIWKWGKSQNPIQNRVKSCWVWKPSSANLSTSKSGQWRQMRSYCVWLSHSQSLTLTSSGLQWCHGRMVKSIDFKFWWLKSSKCVGSNSGRDTCVHEKNTYYNCFPSSRCTNGYCEGRDWYRVWKSL